MTSRDRKPNVASALIRYIFLRPTLWFARAAPRWIEQPSASSRPLLWQWPAVRAQCVWSLWNHCRVVCLWCEVVLVVCYVVFTLTFVLTLLTMSHQTLDHYACPQSRWLRVW